MSTRRNVNLNKELGNDWVGRVRKWEKRWVVCEDKSAPQQPYGGRRPLQLLKWVQTDVRTKPDASVRHPHIVPVTDLSLVPGARLGTPMDAAAAAGQVADPLAAPPIQLTPMETTPSAAAVATPTAAAGAVAPDAPQQQQQQQPAPLVVPAAGSGLPPIPPPAAAAAAGTPSSHFVGFGPTMSMTAATAVAGAAAGGGAADFSLMLRSPSATTGAVSFDLGAAPSGSFQHGVYESTPTAAVSDYTAGTDSEALGRLPHGGVTVSDYTGGADSMDVDQTNRTGDMDDEADQDEDEEVENDEDDDEQGLGDDDEDDGLEDDEGQGYGQDDEDDDDDMPS